MKDIKNPIKDESFIFFSETEENVYPEYYEENVSIKEFDLLKMVNLKNKIKFGIIGHEQNRNSFVYCDNKGSFNIISNIFSFKLNKDNINVLELKDLNKIIGYRDVEEYVNTKNLNNNSKSIVAYHLGYKIENEYLFAKVIVNVHSRKGLSFTIEITPKKDFEAEFELFKEDKKISNKVFKFKEKVKDKIDIKI